MAYIRQKASLTNKYKGNRGEDIASNFLEKHGFTMVCRNYRKAWGEIDIICQKDNYIHFFEVKSITHDGTYISDSHKPEENVSPLKLRHIGRVVETYLSETDSLDREFYFHVLCVYMDLARRRARVKWIKNVIL